VKRLARRSLPFAVALAGVGLAAWLLDRWAMTATIKPINNTDAS
jgi:hypothetical protein